MTQRLVGGLVLVALAAIFLPMLVTRPAPEGNVGEVSMTMPDPPKDDAGRREIPLVVPGQAGANGALNMPMQEVATPAAATTPAPAGPAVAAGDYAVHFGAYATQADASLLKTQLIAAGLPGYVEPTKVGGRDAWRVRIGPYANQAEAEAARVRSTQVRNDVGARVVALNAAPAAPAAATPSPAPAAPAPVAEAPKPTVTAPISAAKPAVVQTPAPTPTKPAATAAPAPVASKPAPTPAPIAAKPVAATPAAPTNPKPAPVAAPVAPKPAASSTGFAVQLGAFANAAEATALRDRARAAGLSAFTESVKTETGTLTRVRLGPARDRAAADALRAQAQSKLGVAGVVRPHP